MWKLRIAEGGPWLKTYNNHIGRQVWEFDPELGTCDDRAAVERAREEFRRNRFHIKQSSDLLMRMQFAKENPYAIKLPQVKVNNNEDVTIEAVTTTLRRSISFYSTIQAHDGHWPGEFSGPLFITAILVIALYITGAINNVLSPEHQKELRRYIYNHQNKDGGWGFNIEGHTIMFSTALSYIALRLLGEEADDGEDGSMVRARNWILGHGGVTVIPTWGKMWLSVLGVFEWSGLNPILPEFFLLPSLLPIHPGRFWCNFRLVYLPMSYLYGNKFVGPITKLVLSLREEIHTHPYHSIDWNQARNLCAKEDLYHPHPFIQDILWDCLYRVGEPLLNHWPLSRLREKALKVAMQYIHYEDENSPYLCIGAGEKVLNMLCCWVEDPSSDAFKFHLARIPDYLWIAEDGMKMQACGSQLWDSAFAVQAIISGDLVGEYGTTLMKAHAFIKDSQLLENPSGDFSRWYRHISKGGWTFSVADHGWQVSDCTAEALKATLLLSKVSPDIVGEPMATERLYDAVNIILSLQNTSGGFSAWELTRTHPWTEFLNASEFFADIILDYQYVECTSSAIQALALFGELYPAHRRKEIETCMAKAIKFIANTQRNDGSWYGSWGICYTYGTWFGVEGLISGGKTYQNSSSIRKASKFLLSKQLDSGGWGESYLSSTNKVYTNLDNYHSHLVNTAWAMLALIKAGQVERNPAPLQLAAAYIINTQLENGDFPQQEPMGSFNKTGMLNYAAYRNIFPIWALGEYRRVLLASKSF